MHQYFVFYASACVCREFDLFREVETVHRLDKPDSADGYKVFHVDTRVFKAFRNVHDKPQVMRNKRVACVRFSVTDVLKNHLFFRFRQRWRKRFRAVYVVAGVFVQL